MCKLKELAWLAIQNRLELNSANALRIDNLIVSQPDGGPLRSILVKPVPMRGHMASGTCINNPGNSCMRGKRWGMDGGVQGVEI